jgi:tellurite resistance protein
MDQKKTGWVAEFRGLLGRMLSPTQTTEPSPDGDGPGAAGLGAEARDTLRFLVKVGQVDGRFDEIERSFTLESLRETGHHATEQDLEEIAVETRFRGAGEFVRPFRAHPLEFRERLLRTGVLLAAASGRVTADEHKALREACQELDIPRETLDLLVKAAIEAPGRD